MKSEAQKLEQKIAGLLAMRNEIGRQILCLECEISSIQYLIDCDMARLSEIKYRPEQTKE
jgi:hypothetical protein